MKLTQEHLDAYTLAATGQGLIDWSARDDSLGVQAVLDLIDPVPDGMRFLEDGSGMRWSRSWDDPMVWDSACGNMHLTAAKIQELFGVESWSPGSTESVENTESPE
ncbi:MAG: hypothetical protein ACRCUC_00260 [Aestuariivirga sp.]